MIQLELGPELEQQLRTEAAAQGVDVTSFVRAKLEQPGLQPLKRTPEEIQAAVQEMLARRVKLGAGETIKDYIEEGRRV